MFHFRNPWRHNSRSLHFMNNRRPLERLVNCSHLELTGRQAAPWCYRVMTWLECNWSHSYAGKQMSWARKMWPGTSYKGNLTLWCMISWWSEGRIGHKKKNKSVKVLSNLGMTHPWNGMWTSVILSNFHLVALHLPSCNNQLLVEHIQFSHSLEGTRGRKDNKLLTWEVDQQAYLL